MPQTLSQMKDHLTVIIGECDILEDMLCMQSDLVTRISVIRNAAYRVVNAIDYPPASNTVTINRRDPHMQEVGAVDFA